MSDDKAGGDSTAPKGKRAPHVKGVPASNAGSPTRVLAPNHLADLQSSGLTLQTIQLAGIYSEGKSRPIAELLGWRWTKGAAMVLPFRDYDSRQVVMARVKPDNPRTRGPKSKPIKYEQPKGTGAVPYFGPRCITGQWLERKLDGKGKPQPICWVEGEKKALLVDQLGLPHIGITGCHNWNDAEKHRNGDGITWAKQLRKYAERFIRGRAHVLVFDSDAFTNENVTLAMQRLAGLLLQDGASSVRFVRIPADVNDPDKGVGIDDYFVSHGEAAARKLFADSEPIEPGSEVSPIPPKDPLLRLGKLQWLKGAKLHSDLRLPPRFEIRRDRSLWMEPPLDKPDGEQKEMMRSTIIPTALLQSVEDEEQRLEMTYFVRGQWHVSQVDRRALRDARRALQELPPNAAISSVNAVHVVSWLDEYMRHNEHRLPLKRYVGSCGWHELEDGTRCFLVDKPIASASSKHAIIADESGDRTDMLSALRPKGSLQAHRAALKRAFDEDPVCALMILASLAAPLVKPLGAPNFGIHLFGDSSTGKTSKMVCGASVYGDPRNEQWVGSWNASGTAMELRAMTLCDLPLFFDEVGAGDRHAIERWIYMLINGSGKSRAQRSLSLRKTPSWRTVVGSTGEHELASDQANTGAQVRVLQFRVNGFGGLDASGVDDVREACANNSGHIGRLWLKTLVQVEDWKPYIDVFKTAKDQFRERESGTLMQRQAVYYALLALAEHVASKELGFGLKGGETVRGVFSDVSKRREVRGAGERAIESVSEWIASEGHSFPSLNFNSSGGLTSNAKAHVKRVNGVRHSDIRHGDLVYFLPERLRAHLEGNGLSYSEVVSSWNDAGHLVCDKGRKAKRVRWDGKRLWVVAVKYEALGLEPEKGQQGQLGSGTASTDDFGG